MRDIIDVKNVDPKKKKR